MKKTLRFRFWLETGMATITGALFVITLLWPQWVEMVFHVSLDNEDGSFERWIVLFLMAATIAFTLMGRYEWKKAQTASQSQSG